MFIWSSLSVGRVQRSCLAQPKMLKSCNWIGGLLRACSEMGGKYVQRTCSVVATAEPSTFLLIAVGLRLVIVGVSVLLFRML